MSIANIFDNLAPNMPVELSSNIVNIEGVPYLDTDNTFTGTNTFNGETDFNGEVTMSANNTFTGTNTFNGLTDFNGTVTMSADEGLVLNNASPDIFWQPGGGGGFSYAIRANTNPAATRIISFYDPGDNCELQLGIPNYVNIFQTTTLTNEQSGSICDIENNTGTAYTITLPSPDDGAWFRFIIAANLMANVTITTGAGNPGSMLGGVVCSASIESGDDYVALAVPNLPLTGQTNMIINTTALLGDSYEFWCNGRWILRGLTGAPTSVTFS
jgi:hypothetical protein